MDGQPEILSLAASILGSVVPRWKGARGESGKNAAPNIAHGATVLVVADPAGTVKNISLNAREVLGEACERAAEFRLTLAELLQPERRADVDELLERFTHTVSDESFSTELLTRSPAGLPRWLEILSRNLLAKPGVAGFLLEIRDATQQRAEATLRALLTETMRSIPDSVIVTDTNGIVQFVNSAFEMRTGYRAVDVIGRTPSFLKSGKHRRDFFELMWRTISEGGSYRNDVLNRRQNGELYWEELVITPVKDAGGTISHYVSVGRDITERKRLEAQAEERAFFDEVTGACTPRLLSERSKSVLALARRHGRSVAMLHLEIAGVPDSQRDAREILRRLGERLRQGLRESDAVARTGPDQFLVLLSEVGEPEATARIARRLHRTICKPFRLQDQNVSIGASIGVALYPQDAASYDELVEFSEAALHRARGTRHGVEFFKRGQTDITNERLSLEDDLRWAWERKQFVLHYQPILALDSGDIIGAEALARGHMIGIEALARWPHLERGMIGPAQFIPMAERTGRIIALDRWAIATAARQAGSWSEKGWAGWVSVNLSPRSLNDSELADYIESCMRQYNVEPGRIVLEITESAAMRDVENTARVLKRLRAVGVLIALDDFGIGHSSLAHLKHFPVDIIKLDRSFVKDIGLDNKIEHLIEVIISLAHRIEASVVAEGVESKTQLDWLRAAGCDYVQGYLIGHPEPAEDVRPVQRVSP
jgi:PAS domain S-box-containing protein/diguanylate cyclase (GGDEF)-like protein